MNDNHVFSDGESWVVAKSADEAEALLQGRDGEDHIPLKEWKQLPDDQALTITDIDEAGAPKHTKTCAQWAAEGRGFLASTEY